MTRRDHCPDCGAATPTMRGDYTANQRGLAAQYATQEWPAFAWPSADDEIATLDRSNA